MPAARACYCLLTPAFARLQPGCADPDLGLAVPSAPALRSAAMHARPTLAALVFALAATWVLALTACDQGPVKERAVGGRGFPCYFDRDCASPTLCESTNAAPFPVCTGVRLRGQTCASDDDCAFSRDVRGLPLECSASAVCLFPGETAAP